MRRLLGFIARPETVLAVLVPLAAIFLIAVLALFLGGCARATPPSIRLADPMLVPAEEDGWYCLREETLDSIRTHLDYCSAALQECAEDKARRVPDSSSDGILKASR